MPTAVILNDTRGDKHFGCERVMRIIESRLEARGVQVIGRSLVRNDWTTDGRFLAALERADIIVINGEGTLHHGSRQGELLLQISRHPARGKKPIALINAIYQDNPESWSDLLAGISIISTRDAWSAAAASIHANREVDHTPDLSLAEDDAQPELARVTPLMISDSVIRSVTKQLVSIAEARPDAVFISITTAMKPAKPHYPPPLRAMRAAYIALHALIFRLGRRYVRFCRSERDYLHAMKTSRLHVTGRFHSACMAIATRTPFIVVDSNSWKIQALIEEFDLNPARICSADDLLSRLEQAELQTFSAAELDNIARGLKRCAEGADHLFDAIAAYAARKA